MSRRLDVVVVLAIALPVSFGSCTRGPRETASPLLPEDQGLYSQAIELQRNDFASDAETVWKDLLSRFPETPRAPEALFWLGLDQAIRGDSREALATFGRLVARFPNGPFADAALLGAAGVHLAAGSDGDVAHARSELELLIARFPKSAFAPEARAGLARIAEGGKRIDAALALYGELSGDPSLAEPDRAALAVRTARITELMSVSEDDAALFLEAEFRLVRGQPAEALRQLEGVAERHPEGPLGAETAYAAGLATALLDQPGRAAEFLARASGAPDASIREDAARARARLTGK